MAEEIDVCLQSPWPAQWLLDEELRLGAEPSCPVSVVVCVNFLVVENKNFEKKEVACLESRGLSEMYVKGTQ